MLSGGTMVSNWSLPNSFCTRNASFSHEMKTSPMPRCTKVVVEPRAPESSTGTFLNKAFTKSFTLVSSPPNLRLANSQAAR
jgi:hypothetical protein